MPSVCFYFQVHQPYRVRRFSYFDSCPNLGFFDESKNAEILRKVAAKCYLPTNRLMLELIKRYQGAFRVAYSITGTAIEQMQAYSPETLESFVKLAETGCVEFLGETHFHSLCSLFDWNEFYEQIEMHKQLMQELFGQTPRVFRNTELIYNDNIGRIVAQRGYHAVLAEGPDDVLDGRSPNMLYTVPGTATRLLTKNFRLSDDVAFRFSNHRWADFPLTTDKFASWVHRISGSGNTVNLFMDYETFGEHQWECSGIFSFLEHLPEAIFRHPHWDFATPSEVAARYNPVSELAFERLTSWADMERDVSPWQGNRMQDSALKAIAELQDEIKGRGDEKLLDVWRKLLSSDHFYYMCTKGLSDGDVHAYFRPYESPYDAFVNYMNVLKDVRRLLGLSTALPMQ